MPQLQIEMRIKGMGLDIYGSSIPRVASSGAPAEADPRVGFRAVLKGDQLARTEVPPSLFPGDLVDVYVAGIAARATVAELLPAAVRLSFIDPPPPDGVVVVAPVAMFACSIDLDELVVLAAKLSVPGGQKTPDGNLVLYSANRPLASFALRGGEPLLVDARVLSGYASAVSSGQAIAGGVSVCDVADGAHFELGYLTNQKLPNLFGAVHVDQLAAAVVAQQPPTDPPSLTTNH